MQYVCTECDSMARFGAAHGPVDRECPVCEAVTRWKPAFDGEAQGVSF
jgi:hypothetical protein